jgi:hypothetical protein
MNLILDIMSEFKADGEMRASVTEDCVGEIYCGESSPAIRLCLSLNY